MDRIILKLQLTFCGITGNLETHTTSTSKELIACLFPIKIIEDWCEFKETGKLEIMTFVSSDNPLSRVRNLKELQD